VRASDDESDGDKVDKDESGSEEEESEAKKVELQDRAQKYGMVSQVDAFGSLCVVAS